MTDLAPPPPAEPGLSGTTPAPRPPRPRRGRSRRGIAVVLVGSLALSGLTRLWADHLRDAALPHRGEQAVSNTSLSSMDSFALGLLLGGLRGPLVMILWTDSENQKTEKNLEGVDTEIEWIRLLQPEFDTVHLFQIWNKAYNISVQMASVANKYDTILGALDYAHNVDLQKPDDINIIATVGQLFFDKLGTSAEKAYYRRRVREESKPHGVEAAARRADIGWRRVSLDPSLDAHFDLLPSAKAELQYLDNPRYEPYTDGLSAFAFAYDYYKRSERLLTEGHQHHDQLSDVVIDSRPALSLKNWADDEVEQARRREAQAFGTVVPDDAVDPDDVTAAFPLSQPVVDRADLNLAVADYDRATQIVPDCLAEYRRHIADYPDRAAQYFLYMAEVAAEAQIAAADRDYLLAMVALPGPERDRLLAASGQAYFSAAAGYDRVMLRYYTDPQVLAKALPPGYAPLPTAGQRPIGDLTDGQTLDAEAIADRMYGPRDADPNADRFEYLRHVHRAFHRMQILQRAIGKAAPTTAPTPPGK